MVVKFKSTKAETKLINQIVDRGVTLAKEYGRDDVTSDPQSSRMDITACHANGNPLRLEEFLASDDFNFSHDFFGINRHLDRSTGKMLNFFSPRFSAPKVNQLNNPPRLGQILEFNNGKFN